MSIDGDSLPQVSRIEACGNGIWRAPAARIIDRSGRKKLPIGDDGFERAMGRSVLVDKTMLIADVIESGYLATLFCRPRRFGKTLNMTMMKSFFEIPPDGCSRAPLFEGTEVWEAGDGCYRAHQGRYPVIHLSLRTAKGDTWDQAYGAIKNMVAREYGRHAYLLDSGALDEADRSYFSSIRTGEADEADYAASLLMLASLLRKQHRQAVVVLIDEYDAPVMAAYSAPGGGYYRAAVSFLKTWLTGALKDGGDVLAFACLTGVQRITKESIFSDLNNLRVSTALDDRFDERYGFTAAEVRALAEYLGCPDSVDEARVWYDGYRFGNTDVYNPWSVLNYFERGCIPGTYWANTSGNEVLESLIRRSGGETLAEVYSLLEPGGTVVKALDLGIVFPETGVGGEAIWSMLYLAGYLTTDLTVAPDDTVLARPLRIPNLEVMRLYRSEVVERFRGEVGGSTRLLALQTALSAGNAELVEGELNRVARDTVGIHDLASENSCHMLMLGVCFGLPGYENPRSNREGGFERYDIRLEPVPVPSGSPESYSAPAVRPRVTIEVKFRRHDEREPLDEGKMRALAQEALDQIARRGYDADPLPACAAGRMRWGIAFFGRHAAVACGWAE